MAGITLQGFAVCPAGLEEALVSELTALTGFTEIAKGRGGARFKAPAQAIARANLWARIPTRILVQAGAGTLRTADDIRQIATKVLWENWFTFRQTLRIDLAVGREPKLDKPLARNFATLLVKDGICDRFRAVRGDRPSIDTTHPDIRVWAYLDQNQLTLYLDTSGEPLFKRGWRQSKGEAPLRENLAAALIAMTDWDGITPVMDPFCGSGTLLIEAMQRALQLPPGYSPQAPRDFAAEHFHANSPMGQVNWQQLRAEARAAIERIAQGLTRHAENASTGIAAPSMQGSDRDERMIRIAEQNAQRALPALAAKAIRWVHAEFNQVLPIASNGLLVANPPYGKRLSKTESSSNHKGDAPTISARRHDATQTIEPPVNEAPDYSFERHLAEQLKKKFSGWQAWLLTDDPKLETGLRLKAARRIPVFNGDIECRWMRFDMVSGSMREKS